MLRWNTVEKLVHLGTNSWPAVPALGLALTSNDFGIIAAAAEVLARTGADCAPTWPDVKAGLRGNTNAFNAFRWIVLGKDRFSRAFDVTSRRVGLEGLAAIGPVAKVVAADLERMISSKEDYPLWPTVVSALRGVGATPKQVAPVLKRVVDNPDEHPEIRVSAVRALSVVGADDPDVRPLLARLLEDQSSYVRIAAARGLWSMRVDPEQVLPILTALLRHKLVAVRLAALDGLREIGPAARPSRSAVAALADDPNDQIREAARTVLRQLM